MGRKNSANEPQYQYKNKDILLGDGTLFSLEDTEEVKRKYKVSKRNNKQSGWPKMRLLALFNAGSGAFIDGEVGAYCGKGQGEITLIKKVTSRIKKDSILVLDRLFTSIDFRDLITLDCINYVIRARDNKAKKLLKKKQEIIVLEKSSVGRILKTRYIRSKFRRDGYRDTEIFIVTNLLKEDGHKKSEIEKIYSLRWGVELDFRNLKETLDAGKLRGKSSEMVEKELWVNLIAYNMIRKISSMMSLKNKKKVREQSFKAGKELLEILITGRGKKIFEELLELFKGEFLKTKFRREPRLIRFAGKKYDVLKTTRNKAKIMLEQGLQVGGYKGLSINEAA